MKHLLIGIVAITGAVAAPTAFSAPAATLLFTQPGAKILDEQGLARPAKRGDVLQTGERLVTPPGAISQLRLPDGSLLGMRPDSELKIDLPPQASDRAQRVVSLLHGSVRVVGSELMDAKKPSNFTLQTGLATLKLKGADLESAIVPPDSAPKPGATAAGSYNRMLIGTGSIGNGTMVEPLTPKQVSFVGAINTAPIQLSVASSTLFNEKIVINTTPLDVGKTTITDSPPVALRDLPKLPVISGSFPRLDLNQSLPGSVTAASGSLGTTFQQSTFQQSTVQLNQTNTQLNLTNTQLNQNAKLRAACPKLTRC